MKQIIETIMVMTYCIGLFVLTAHAQKANSLDISNRHLQENTVLQNSNEVQTPDIIGTWCNNSLYEETGEFFQLEITQDNNKTIAMYNNGGPFEIQFHVKSNKENIQLFFDQISGTTSFANAFGNKQFTKEHPMDRTRGVVYQKTLFCRERQIHFKEIAKR